MVAGAAWTGKCTNSIKAPASKIPSPDVALFTKLKDAENKPSDLRPVLISLSSTTSAIMEETRIPEQIASARPMVMVLKKISSNVVEPSGGIRPKYLSVMVMLLTNNEANAVTTYPRDRKSTRLNSSHMSISYAVFCLKKKNK